MQENRGESYIRYSPNSKVREVRDLSPNTIRQGASYMVPGQTLYPATKTYAAGQVIPSQTYTSSIRNVSQERINHPSSSYVLQNGQRIESVNSSNILSNQNLVNRMSMGGVPIALNGQSGQVTEIPEGAQLTYIPVYIPAQPVQTVQYIQPKTETITIQQPQVIKQEIQQPVEVQAYQKMPEQAVQEPSEADIKANALLQNENDVLKNLNNNLLDQYNDLQEKIKMENSRVEVPVYHEKIVTYQDEQKIADMKRQIEHLRNQKPQVIEKRIEKPVYRQKIVEVEVEKVVDEVVHIDKVEPIQRIEYNDITVEKPVYRQRVVEVEVPETEVIIEKVPKKVVQYLEKEVVVEVPQIKEVEKVVYIDKVQEEKEIQYVDKYVEKQVYVDEPEPVLQEQQNIQYQQPQYQQPPQYQQMMMAPQMVPMEYQQPLNLSHNKSADVSYMRAPPQQNVQYQEMPPEVEYTEKVVHVKNEARIEKLKQEIENMKNKQPDVKYYEIVPTGYTTRLINDPNAQDKKRAKSKNRITGKQGEYIEQNGSQQQLQNQIKMSQQSNQYRQEEQYRQQ